jgi:hypothetical protein
MPILTRLRSKKGPTQKTDFPFTDLVPGRRLIDDGRSV